MADFIFDNLETNVINVVTSDNSTSTSTGSIITLGGIGVARNVYIGGETHLSDILNMTDTTTSSDSATGSLVTAGGVGIGGRLNVADNVIIEDTTNSTSSVTGALVVSGGLGVALDSNFDGTLDVDDVVTVTASDNSTSTTTGALISGGGLGVLRDAYIGGVINATNATQSTSASDGAVLLTGGIGIAKNAYVGGLVNVTGTITTTDATESVSTSSGALVVTGGIGVAKRINNAGANGDLLTGNGTTMTPLTIGSLNQVLTVTSDTEISWATPATTNTNWATISLDGQTALSPVSSIDSDRSEYASVADIGIINLDVTFTTDGTSSITSVTLLGGSSIGAPTGASGTRYSSLAYFISGASRQMGVAYIDAGNASDVVSLETTGILAASTTYRCTSSITYQI